MGDDVGEGIVCKRNRVLEMMRECGKERVGESWCLGECGRSYVSVREEWKNVGEGR